ncbi:hypothetical protein PPACK8108_LOCUS6602 [Phakopsora pachyrhizi]|uniref:Uncharacterized protein n=1 Tax=Phakopsora pachyrhizi TaxID=170000 RepID=A0AAV0AU55_PHAPC|nr:hypothetical protein PPACK8108_LOCUS6602 [Phakopsora pachyrhizi]
MNYKLHGPRGPRPDLRKDMNKANTDAAHNAAYLGESTPPIGTFIKLSSLTKLKKSLSQEQAPTLLWGLSTVLLSASSYIDPANRVDQFQTVRIALGCSIGRARLKYTLDDKNEDGDEVIEDIREAAKPFHLRKAHIREDLRMAMVIIGRLSIPVGKLSRKGIFVSTYEFTKMSLIELIKSRGRSVHRIGNTEMEGPTASAGYLIVDH